MITCLIPAYNESKRVAAIIHTLNQAKKQGLINKVVVVSDGSTDDTAEVARKAGADQIISYPKNRGKGFAVLSGLKAAPKGDILLLDADLTNFTLDHLKQMLIAGQAEGVLMVIGFLNDDFGQQIAPQLSGQRFIKRSLADKIIEQQWENSRFNIEVLMNRLVRKTKNTTVLVPLSNLGHFSRKNKYKPYQFLYHKFHFSFGLANIYRNLLAGALSIFLAAYLALIMFTPIKTSSSNLPQLPAITKDDRILVVAAHPDDEAICCAGFIYDAVQKGASVSVVVVSAGDANRFSAGVMDKDVTPGKIDFEKEGQVRLHESEAALDELGVKNKYYLGFPDRKLKKMLTHNWDQPLTSSFSGYDSNRYPDTFKQGAPYNGKELFAQLETIISEQKPTVIITHAKVDTNTDHQAVSSFTNLAVNDLTQREKLPKANEYAFLVHWNITEYPRPFRKAPNISLVPPKELRNKYRWYNYPLTKSTQNKKRSALTNYHSQLTSPFLKGLIEAMDRNNELFYSP